MHMESFILADSKLVNEAFLAVRKTLLISVELPDNW